MSNYSHSDGQSLEVRSLTNEMLGKNYGGMAKVATDSIIKENADHSVSLSMQMCNIMNWAYVNSCVWVATHQRLAARTDAHSIAPIYIYPASARRLLLKKDNRIDQIGRKRGLTIAGLNIRSLPPKVSQIECLLEGEGIRVLCLSESWLNKNTHNNLIRVRNYKIYRWDKESKKRGGGIRAYVHQN